MSVQGLREKDSSFGYLVSILGFGLCRAWIVFCLSVPLTSPRFTNSWLFLLAGALAALGVPLITSRFSITFECLRLRLFRVTAGFLFAGAVLIPCALWVNSWALLLVSWVLGGVGAGFLQVLWGERFAAYSPRFSQIVAPAAAILTAVVVVLSSSETALIALFIFPLVSFVLLVFEIDGSRFGHRLLTGRSRQGAAEGGEGVLSQEMPENMVQATAGKSAVQPDPIRGKGFEPAVWKLMFSILAFSFICRSFDALPVENAGPFSLFGGSVLPALVVVGVTFLIMAAFLKERFNVALTYRFSLPLMMIGFAVLALFINSHAAMSLFLINMGYEFFDILSWILFAEIARRDKDSVFRVFGLGVAFTFMGMALGYFFGDTLVGLLINDTTQATGIVLLCMVALVLVAFLVIPEGTVLHLTGALFTERRLAEKGASDVAAHDAPASDATLGTSGVTGEEALGQTSVWPRSLEQTCEWVATDYRLTAREGEVLRLLARGRTLAIIARELNIARGTVRTHIERVYAKLGVHKQQELIDLIEGFGKKSN
jgi:DNA-binding CsgD family transcriptional regulator